MFPIIADAALPSLPEMAAYYLEDYWPIALLIAAAVTLAVVLIVKLGKKKKK